ESPPGDAAGLPRIGLSALGVRARPPGKRRLLDPRRQRACGRGRRRAPPVRGRPGRSLAAALPASAAARGVGSVRGSAGSAAARCAAVPRAAERYGAILSAGRLRDAAPRVAELRARSALSVPDADSKTRLTPAARPRRGFASWPTRRRDP